MCLKYRSLKMITVSEIDDRSKILLPNTSFRDSSVAELISIFPDPPSHNNSIDSFPVLGCRQKTSGGSANTVWSSAQTAFARKQDRWLDTCRRTDGESFSHSVSFTSFGSDGSFCLLLLFVFWPHPSRSRPKWSCPPFILLIFRN